MDVTAAALRCRNCDIYLGDPPGNYCPGCGQDTANHPPTFWEFFHEFITHYVALEGKLWRTLTLLFFKPAELTREFRAGRKQRYISPLRLYITASFLFFLVVKIAGFGNLVHVETTTGEAAKAERGAISFSYKPDAPTDERALEELNSKPADMQLECAPDQRLCKELQSRLTKKYVGKTGKDVIEMMKSGVLANVPYALFLLLPLFALLTKLLYIKRGWYFGEHVVYALHVHAFTFFVLLLKATLPRYIGDFVLLAALVYYFIALQRFFGGRWWATTLRYAFIGTFYPLLMALVTSAVVLFVLVA